MGKMDWGNVLTLHACASGTMWSMSTEDEAVTVTPSYGEYHEPLVGWHALSVLTPVPSRTRTISLEVSGYTYYIFSHQVLTEHRKSPGC